MENGQPSKPAPLRINRRTSKWHTIKPGVTVVSFVLGVLVAASGINAFVFQSYYVEGSSMHPTLEDDDRLIVGKTETLIAGFKGERYVPSRGDIIVLDSDIIDPGHPGQHEQLIKRVIGLPGEVIAIQNGILKIFNKAHPDGFNVDAQLGLQLAPTFSNQPLRIKLAADEVFVIGDNRGPGGSLDSRSFGPVKLDRIKGNLWMRVFPLSDVKLF